MGEIADMAGVSYLLSDYASPEEIEASIRELKTRYKELGIHLGKNLDWEARRARSCLNHNIKRLREGVIPEGGQYSGDDSYSLRVDVGSIPLTAAILERVGKARQRDVAEFYRQNTGYRGCGSM
jgi:hypothetical protein